MHYNFNIQIESTSSYPREQSKISLAKAIVEKFPLLKNDLSVNGYVRINILYILK